MPIEFNLFYSIGVGACAWGYTVLLPWVVRYSWAIPGSSLPPSREPSRAVAGVPEPPFWRPPNEQAFALNFGLGLYFKTMGLYAGAVPHKPEHNP